MYRRRVALVLFLSVVSCKQEFKRCDCSIADEKLSAYNDIFNDIIVNRTFGYFLGPEAARLDSEYGVKDEDGWKREAIKWQHKMFSDTSLLCTIFLDTMMRKEFNPWRFRLLDSSKYNRMIDSVITSYSIEGQQAIDSLNTLEERYSPEDFSLCSARVKSIRSLGKNDHVCYIGKIAFSKLIFNPAHDRGLLYYQFRCGGGYGSPICIQKKEGHWSIGKDYVIWEM